MFQDFALTLDRRDDVRELIGEHAELVAWVNCVMDRSTFDAQIDGSAPYAIRDRTTGDTITLDEQQFNDLCTVHLCDWLEQLPRLGKWDFRRDAYRGLAERLGGVALESFERVFADEPTHAAGTS